ncbi:MAG: hypothetical protein J0M24_02390 [Verrucomicrobia bacterium]|nr:hypothetical protein [Verrucomicrobiota bacterium]
MAPAATAYFEDELLPSWARLLDLAARLAGMPRETQDWFVGFCRGPGVSDTERLEVHCRRLLEALKQPERTLVVSLQRTPMDRQPGTIIAAWRYSLETMLQQAGVRSSCAWRWSDSETGNDDDSGGGEITLRRV